MLDLRVLLADLHYEIVLKLSQSKYSA